MFPFAAQKSERRTVTRSRCSVKAVIALIQLRSPAWHAVNLLDISANGLGFRFSRRIEPGSFLAIKPNTKAGTTLRAKVVHATPTQDGDWHVGCLLSEPLARNEIRAFL